jgi:hypothetical protein
MGTLQQFQELNTIREKATEIRGIPVLFREPPIAEKNTARKKHLKWVMEETSETGGKTEQKMVIDSANSDWPAYHRDLVMMTAHDPESKERMFPNGAAFDSLFRTVNGVAKHGETLFNEFRDHAQDVSQPVSADEAEKN